MPRIPGMRIIGGRRIQPRRDLFGNLIDPLPPEPLKRPLSIEDVIPILDERGRRPFPSEVIGKYDPRPTDPIDEIQRMLNFQAPEPPGGDAVTRRPPAGRFTPPHPARIRREKLLDKQAGVAEIDRLLSQPDVIPGRPSDVADPLSPDEFEGDVIIPGGQTNQDVKMPRRYKSPENPTGFTVKEGDRTAFEREYVPGGMEETFLSRLPEEEIEATTGKLSTLSRSMGQDEYIRLNQQLAEDPDPLSILTTINNALGIAHAKGGTYTSGKQLFKPQVSGPPRIGLPESALDLDTEIPNQMSTLSRMEKAVRNPADPKKRILQRGGKEIPQGRGMLSDDIAGYAVKKTPWGDYKPYRGKIPPLGREKDVNVGDVVEVDGEKLRGKIVSITGGTKRVDVQQVRAKRKGDEKNWAGIADPVDVSDLDYVTTAISGAVDQRSGKPYLKRKMAGRPNMTRVEMADGRIVQKPLSKVRLVRPGQVEKVDDPELREKIISTKADLEQGKQPDVSGIPSTLNPIAPGVAKVGGSSKPYYELASDTPTAGGFYIVRKLEKGKPVPWEGKAQTGEEGGYWVRIGQDEAERRGIVPPRKGVRPDIRRSNVVGKVEEGDLPHLAEMSVEARPMVKGQTITETGTTGGVWREPPEVGSIHKIKQGGKDLLVQVREVVPEENGKIGVRWEVVGRKEGKVWKRVRGEKIGEDEGLSPTKSPTTSAENPYPSALPIRPGQDIDHPAFGKGKVLAVEDRKDGRNLHVKFKNGVTTTIRYNAGMAGDPAPAPSLRIISGGQTGVDRAGLEVAKELGIATGGTAPKGYRTQRGSDPSLKDFGLGEDASPDYRPRTIKNVQDADGTVWFGDPNSPGGRLTLSTARNLNKPNLVNPSVEQLVQWMKAKGIKTLNVAGNRENTNPKAAKQAREVLSQALKKLIPAAVVGIGGTLMGEKEAEAARLPSSLKISQARTQQHAPVVHVPTTDAWTRAKRLVSNKTDLPEHLGTIMEQRGEGVDPETNSRNTIPTYVRGGLAATEMWLNELNAGVKPVRKAKLNDQFEDLLNLKGYDHAINVVMDKRDRALGRATELYAKGEEKLGLAAEQEAAEYTKRLNENKVVPLGYGKDEIARDIAAIEATMTPEQVGVIRQAEKVVFGITRRLLEEARKEGLISDEQFAFYTSRGDNYLPLYRLQDLFDPNTGMMIRKQYLSKQDDFRPDQSRISLLDEDIISSPLEGSERMNKHPLAAVATYIDGLSSEIQRNKAARSTLESFEKHQSVFKQMLAEGDAFGRHGLVRRLGNSPPKGEAPEGRAYVGYMDKGKTVYYEVDADLATTMTHVDPEIMRGAARVMSITRGLFQMLVAGAQPPFMFKQMIIDLPVSAAFTPKTKYVRTAVTPDMARQFLKTWGQEFLTGYLNNIGIDATPVVGKSRFAGELERENAMGGALNAYVDPMERALGPIEGVWNQETKLAKKLIRAATYGAQQMIRVGLQPAERAAKAAGYDLMRHRGYGPVEAAANARKFSGSPDFSMWGTLLHEERNKFVFLTPWMSGLSRTLEGVKSDPVKFAKYAALLAIGYKAIKEHNAQFVDDDGRPEIDKIPPEEREGKVIWFYGEPEITATGDKRQPYTALPIGPEFQLLLAPALAIMNGLDDPNYSPVQGVADVASNFLPGTAKIDASSGPQEFIDSVGRRIGASLNPLLRMGFEIPMRKELHTNTPIVGSRAGGMIPEYQSTLRTPPGAVAIGKALGVSPDWTAYLMKNAMPGLAGLIAEGVGEVIGAPDRLTAPLESPTEQMLRAPVTGQFARKIFGSISTNAELNRKRNIFYDFKEQTQQAANTIGGQAGRNPWELENISDDVKKLSALNPTMTKFQLVLSQIDKSRELLIRNNDTPVADRKQALHELFKSEMQIMDAVEGLITRMKERR